MDSVLEHNTLEDVAQPPRCHHPAGRIFKRPHHCSRAHDGGAVVTVDSDRGAGQHTQAGAVA
jgi:hypothetical protein